MGWRECHGVENVITMTALSTQIDGVEGVSWCHGVENVITMTALSRQIDG